MEKIIGEQIAYEEPVESEGAMFLELHKEEGKKLWQVGGKTQKNVVSFCFPQYKPANPSEQRGA